MPSNDYILMSKTVYFNPYINHDTVIDNYYLYVASKRKKYLIKYPKNTYDQCTKLAINRWKKHKKQYNLPKKKK